MAALLEFLDTARPDHVYNAEDLARLQAVFDQACADLGFDPQSTKGESVAAFLFQAERTCESELLGVVIRAFR